MMIAPPIRWLVLPQRARPRFRSLRPAAWWRPAAPGGHHGDGDDDHVCNGGDDGDDWEVGGCHLETGDGVQLCRLLINFA